MTESGNPMSSMNSATIGPLAHWHPLPDHPVLLEAVGDALRRQAQDNPNNRALWWLEDDGIASLTYAELFTAATNVAGWLLARAKPGDRVAVWARNSVDWAVVEYGCALAGMVLASWNTSWVDAEVQHAMDLTQPVIIFAGEDTRGVSLLERARSLSNQQEVARIEEARQLIVEGDIRLPLVTSDSPFIIQFTSGTTGKAKGALLSHRAALNGGYFRALSTGGKSDDIYLNSTPMHHIGGSVSLLLGSMSIGASYVIMGTSKPEEMIRAARLSGATRFGGVPTMLIAMIEHPTFPKGKLRFRSVGAGATQVPEALVHRLTKEFDAVVSIGYAQSECPLISNTAADDPAAIIATTVGRPYGGNEVKIINPTTGETLPVGEIGEICVRSATVMEGYYNAPEANRQVFDLEGFLRTGDLASMDQYGYLRMSGRAREVVIRGGENIYPIEVEQVLHQHPAVSIAAVLGVPDDKWGQQVAAVIKPAPGMTLDIEELKTFVRERVAHFKVPRHWRIEENLPMTASGKVRKLDLVTMFSDSQREVV